MNSSDGAGTSQNTFRDVVKEGWALGVSLSTTALFFANSDKWFADLSSPVWFAFLFAWLFAAILISAFAVVRHADSMAVLLGEPLGTLVLTLSMSGMEMMMITAVMYAGTGESSLARDTMFAVVMVVLNGLVGACLLLGGLRYLEQTYNLYGASSFLSVLLPLAVLGLILPNFTVSSPGPTFSPLQAIFLVIMSLGLYGVFLMTQTRRHRGYFVAPGGEIEGDHDDSHGETRSIGYHGAMLLAHVLPIVLLAKKIAVPIDYATNVLKAPAALGGLLVATLILSPEAMAAVRAAKANKLQRAINLALGTALSTISLTIPAVLIIGFVTGKTIILGLDPANSVLLLLSLVVSMLTFARERTNALLGAVHIILFLAYLTLIFAG